MRLCYLIYCHFIDQETQADTGSSSGSLQLVKSASESSCSTNTEQTLSTSEERGKKDISCFESHCVSSLKLTSSEGKPEVLD